MFLDEAEYFVNLSLSGHKFTLKECKELIKKELNFLGIVADEIRKKVCKDVVTFVQDTTINYTNICTCKCKFCAFYAKDNGYTLSIKEILKKVKNAVSRGATQILIQGGLNPELKIEYYEEIIKKIKEKFPFVQRHFFSAPEIYFIAKINNLSIQEVLERFIEAGLQSLPGGGAEILDNKIRKEISPNKIKFEEWKEVIIKAHKLGLKTTSTMVFGFGEGKEERIKHILRIRDIQEQTKGFTAFIPWSYQFDKTSLGKPKNFSYSTDYLEIIAMSRIILNNLKNIQASRLTEGNKIAQIALFYGANDFSGTIVEENVLKATGIENNYLPEENIIELIRQVKRIPAQRDTLYNIIKMYS